MEKGRVIPDNINWPPFAMPSVDISSQGADIAASHLCGDSEDEREESSNQGVQYYLNEQLMGLAVAKAVLDRFGKLNEGFSRTLVEFQRALRL